MREILFRGQTRRKGQKVWMDGSPVDSNWVEGYGVCVGKGDFSVIYAGSPVDKFTVYTDTVCQFTGRTDKNGKKVFEHDVLQILTVWADGTVEKGGIGIVQWWENDQCYVLATKEGYHIDDFGNLGRPEYYEVIGNIHDNPELLGGADNG